jgi:LysR family hydrogen peroxide-inducible transcriptional activator
MQSITIDYRFMSLAGLSLRDLDYAVAVADLRHFGRAAERCGVSQPGLSAQLAKLEARLGAPLFERAGRRVLLTPFGEEMVRRARQVLAEARGLVEAARSWSGLLSGPLAVGAIQTLGPYLFPHILKPLRERYPAVELRLEEGRTEGLLRDLREGRLDCVLLALPVEGEGLAAAPLFFEPFRLACPAGHSLETAPLRTLSGHLADLPTDSLLLLEEGHCLRDQALAVCAQARPTGRHATGLETLRHMVGAGAGWSLLPALAAPGGSSMDGLVTHRALGPVAPGRTVALAWRRSDPRGPRLQELAGFIKDLDLPGRLGFG